MGLLKAKRHEKTFPFLQVHQDLNSHMQLMSWDASGDRRFWDNIRLSQENALCHSACFWKCLVAGRAANPGLLISPGEISSMEREHGRTDKRGKILPIFMQ